MESAAMYEDRRTYERKDCRLPADLDDYDNTYCGLIRNIGKGGAYVETAGASGTQIGREVLMTIPFKNNSNYLIIKAKVAWTRPDGVGVSFIRSQAIY